MAFDRRALFIGAAILIPGAAWAAGGGGSDAPLVIVADTRHLDGAMAWLANLYNETRLGFTLFTIGIIPLVGLMFGLTADFALGMIGLDLRHRGTADH